MHSIAVIMFCLAMAQPTTESRQASLEDDLLYFISNHGDYVALERSGKLVREGNLWETTFNSEHERDEYGNLKYRLIYDVERDPVASRLFFLIGHGQLDGYLVTGLDLRFQRFLEKKMALGPTETAFDPSGKKLYLTFLVQPDPKEEVFETRTTIYDARLLEQVSEVDPESTGLFIRPYHCFPTQDRLFTGWWRIFDTESDTLVESIEVPGHTVPIDCHHGRVLSTGSENGKTVVDVFDLEHKRLVSKISTSVDFRLSEDEWHLSPTGRYIVWDSTRPGGPPSGERTVGKAGHLFFYDAESGEKTGDLNIELKQPDFSGLMAISPDGSLLVYLSYPNKIILVDYPSLKTKDVELDIEPRWVVRGLPAGKSP